MNKAITPEIRDVMEAIHYRPAVSLIRPFEARVSLKREMAQSVKAAADQVEKELKEICPDETVRVVMQRLRAVIKNLRFESDKKSIAIYVSPIFQKVIYLDIPVEEKIVIDESFEIRDLLYSKKQLHKYLVLLLSTNESRMYMGNSDTFIRIVSDIPDSVKTYYNDPPERGSYYADVAVRKEKVIESFLHQVDIGLDSLLRAYDLPVFVIGNDRILEQFKKLSKHSAGVIEYIQGNYEEAGVSKLKELMKIHVHDWQKKKQSELLNMLEIAAKRNELAFGMSNVWAEVMKQKGRLLIVEKNYLYDAPDGLNVNELLPAQVSPNKSFSIKDAVDDLIERLLKYGGDVEFVDTDVLKDYNQIALVKYI